MFVPSMSRWRLMSSIVIGQSLTLEMAFSNPVALTIILLMRHPAMSALSISALVYFAFSCSLVRLA